MTFEPTGIALRFEEMIVQKPPDLCVYSWHSFVTWRSPLRGEAAEADGTRTASNAIVAPTTRSLRTERISNLPASRRVGCVIGSARSRPPDWATARQRLPPFDQRMIGWLSGEPQRGFP